MINIVSHVIFKKKHKKDIKYLKVFAIKAISMGTFTANERFCLLCRREHFWIFMMGSLSPHGLNEELETNTLI